MLDNGRRLWIVGPAPPFVSTRVCNGEGETYRSMNMCGSLWKDRRMLWLYLVRSFFDTTLHDRVFARSVYPSIDQTKISDLFFESVPLPGGKLKPRSDMAQHVWDAFDTVRHAQHTCSLSRYHSHKPRRYAPGIDADPQGYRKWSDAWRLWSVRKFSLWFLSFI